MMKRNTVLGVVLGLSLIFAGCGSSKVEFDKSKDYKPEEVKKIVFHENQANDLIKLVSQKLTPEESSKFKRSILMIHKRFGAKAEGKTIGELFDLKLTKEEVLKVKFDPSNYDAAYDAVEASELSDKEKKRFETCVRGYDPRIWTGKTIGEMLTLSEKYAKGELQPPKLSQVLASNVYKEGSADELLEALWKDRWGKRTLINELKGKALKITGRVIGKDYVAGTIQINLGDIHDKTLIVVFDSKDVNLLNSIPVRNFVSIVGIFDERSTHDGEGTYAITHAQFVN